MLVYSCLALGFLWLAVDPVDNMHCYIHWQCQSADFSVTPSSVMMASYILCLLPVVLCTVHSYSISGTIHHNQDAVSEVKVSNYINGNNWHNAQVLTLDRLVDTKILPTLTLANFNSLYTLYLTNISLEHVPVFINTTFRYMYITRNRIKSVPANAFSGPQPSRLNLNNNEIQSMADSSINTGASHVILSCNQLSDFSQSWFEDPGSVEALSLDGNRIEDIQDRAFNQMTKLSTLFIRHNHLASIGSETFNSGVKYLDLNFNDIAQLTADMFARRHMPMESLYLHHNQLSYLSEALLLKLKPKAISLVGNPWQCQCLQDIERWLREMNSTRHDIPSRRGEPVCVMPRNFVDVCIPVVDTELQQTYAKKLSPVPGCLATSCQPCNNTEEIFLAPLP